MKTGDKVRFLNEVGEGRIVSFQSKDIAVVEDADGFEVPVAVRDLVAVETDDYNVPNKKQQEKRQEKERRTASGSATDVYGETKDAALPASFQPERRGADRLNVSLAFVPQDIRQFSITAFESYLVNDSNYYLYYNLLSQDGTLWTLRSNGYIEPNTKLLLEEFDRTALNGLEHLTIQLLAFKDKKKFTRKPAVDVELRLDTKKFFRLNSFDASDFFDVPSLIVDVIRDDMPVRELEVSAQQLEQALMEKRDADSHASAPQPKTRQEKNGIVEVDLHINALLDNTHGLSNGDMLRCQIDKFNEVMQEYRRKSGQRIVFIHGKGEGVLRKAILAELKQKYRACTWQDASFQEYGFGATLVTVRQ